MVDENRPPFIALKKNRSLCSASMIVILHHLQQQAAKVDLLFPVSLKEYLHRPKNPFALRRAKPLPCSPLFKLGPADWTPRKCMPAFLTGF